MDARSPQDHRRIGSYDASIVRHLVRRHDTSGIGIGRIEGDDLESALAPTRLLHHEAGDGRYRIPRRAEAGDFAVGGAVGSGGRRLERIDFRRIGFAGPQRFIRDEGDAAGVGDPKEPPLRRQPPMRWVGPKNQRASSRAREREAVEPSLQRSSRAGDGRETRSISSRKDAIRNMTATSLKP